MSPKSIEAQPPIACRHATDAIHTAVTRILADAHQREQANRERRAEPRWTIQRPVRVMPFRDEADRSVPDTSRMLTAVVRGISRNGIGLLHDRRLESRRVLVTFEFLEGDASSLIVEMKWSYALGDFGYASGGSLVGVLAPTADG